jgi:colicin import membrane protein
MSIARERLEFAPPPTPGLVRAILMAVLAHGLLAGVLSAGIQWRRETPPVTVQAELWSALPQEAAPPEPEPVLPEPTPQPTPEPEPAPAPPVEKPVPPPAPDIALEREKARLKKEKAEKLEREKLEKEKLQKEKARKEKEKEKDKQDRLDKEKQAKLAKDKKQLQEKKAQEALEAKENKKLEELRQQNLKRMAGLAGGTGGPNDAGSAVRASGPSPGYAGRIKARIRPNVTFTETVSGNPVVEVEIRTSPDGTILSQKISKSSGVPSWDNAVLRGIEKTEILPKDVDGTIPTRMTIVYSLRD